MATINPSSGAQAATISGTEQLRLQQAVRNAARAEQTARSLRQQAENAQREADRSQEAARSLVVRSDQAEADAGRARQGVDAIAGASRNLAQVSRIVRQTDERLTPKVAEPAPAAEVAIAPASAATAGALPIPASPAVINPDGQVTGTVINTTA